MSLLSQYPSPLLFSTQGGLVPVSQKSVTNIQWGSNSGRLLGIDHANFLCVGLAIQCLSRFALCKAVCLYNFLISCFYDKCCWLCPKCIQVQKVGTSFDTFMVYARIYTLCHILIHCFQLNFGLCSLYTKVAIFVNITRN